MTCSGNGLGPYPCCLFCWVQEFALTMVHFYRQVAEFQNGVVIAEGRVSLLILDLENGSPWT